MNMKAQVRKSKYPKSGVGSISIFSVKEVSRIVELSEAQGSQQAVRRGLRPEDMVIVLVCRFCCVVCWELWSIRRSDAVAGPE